MKQKIGIIWVDDNTSNGGFRHVNHGLECISSDPDKIRQVNLRNLDAQRIYITNAKPHVFSKMGLERFPNIKSSKFLGVMLSTVAVELDLPNDIQAKLPVFYTLFQMLAEKLQDDYGIDLTTNDFTILKTLHEKILPENQKQRPLLGMNISLELERAIGQSMQKIQANSSRRVKGVQAVCSARFPRAPYALSLLNFVFPASNIYKESDTFKDVEIGTTESGLLPNTERVISELIALSKTKCGFIHINQTSTVEKYNHHHPLGQTVQHSEIRNWACLPEVIDLLNYSTIKLGVMFVTDGQRMPIAPAIPSSSDVSFMSYVNGLVNEIVWTSLGYSDKNDICPPPLSVYMRAYDRIMCRIKAKSFIDEQFSICGYSTGVLRFFTEKSNPEYTEALKLKILEQDLIPQLSIVK